MSVREKQATMQQRLEPFLETNLAFRSGKDGGISEVHRLAPSVDKDGNVLPLRFSKKIIARVEGDLSRLIEYEGRFLYTLRRRDHAVRVVKSLGKSEIYSGSKEHQIVTHQLLTESAGVDIYHWRLLPIQLQQNQQYYYNLFCHPGALLRLVKGCLLAFQSIHQHGVVHCDIKGDQICVPLKVEKKGDYYHFFPQFEEVTFIDFGNAIWKEVNIESWVNPLPFNIKKALPYQAKLLIQTVEKQHLYYKEHKAFNFAQVVQDLDYGVDLYSFGYLLKSMLQDTVDRYLNMHDLQAWNVFLEDYKKWIDELLTQSYGIMPPYTRQNLPYKDYLAKVDAWIEQVDAILGYSSKDLECVINPNQSITDVYKNLDVKTPIDIPDEAKNVKLSSQKEVKSVNWSMDISHEAKNVKWSRKKLTLIASCVMIPILLVALWLYSTSMVDINNVNNSEQKRLQQAIKQYDADNYGEAFKLFRTLAEQGNAEAQTYLGYMYDEGVGVTQNYAEALKWYRKAAEQGDADAQNSLGYMYDEGLGVTQDYAEAVKWYRKAAEQGDADAQNSLGHMYDEGLGVTQDYAEAVKWYRKAAEQGDAIAQTNLGIMYYDGTGVAENYAEAVEWFRKAAEQGIAEAQNRLGYMYQHGLGVTQDDAEAVKWYRKAAEQGDVDAQNNLGNMYHEGLGVTQNGAEAVKWYRKAAEQGDADSQSKLGFMYQYGYGVTQNYAEAVKWYRKAAEQGDADAQNSLAYMYKEGLGVTQDDTEALKWYRKAAEQGDEGAKYALKRLEKKVNKGERK